MTRDKLFFPGSSSENCSIEQKLYHEEERFQEIALKLQKNLTLMAEYISIRFSYENTLRLSRFGNEFTVQLQEIVALRDPSPFACLPLETELNEAIMLVNWSFTAILLFRIGV